VDAVVNLSGAGLGDRRWSEEYKRTLRDSRVKSTATLADAIAGAARPPTLLSASGVGWYGDRDDEQLTEDSARGSGFLSDLCADWESATAAASGAGARVVHLRTGIVLSRHGGALKKQLPLFKVGLAGRFGSGRQWQSWISVDDHVRAVEHLLDADVSGPVNLASPAPVTNAEMTDTLARALHRPSLLVIPRFLPSLVLGGELVDELLFASQRVHPQRLLDTGFAFRHETLDVALRSILER
jgi:hypothetical protein